MLIRNARLVGLTVPAPSGLVDVVVHDGFVDEVKPASGDSSNVPGPSYNAAGQWLMPGLWDAHVHLGQWTLSAARVDVSMARSAAQAVGIVRERLAEFPDLPVIGWGHRPTDWDEAPVVSMLDAIETDQPIVLMAGDGHHGWLNTVALHHLALPTREGVVAEGEWFLAYGRLSAMYGVDATGPEAYRRTMDHALSQGVVGLVDFEFTGGVTEWVERWEEGADRMRVRMATYTEGLDDVIARGLRTGDRIASPDIDPHGLLTMGPFKIISDGSLNTRTAWCCDPYAEKAVLGFPHGSANQTEEELREVLTRATAAGLEVAVHAIGDRACTEALDAIADTGARGSIEHAQLTRREDVRRMAELGIRASVQPAHLIDDRDVTDRLWPGRGNRCFALQWMDEDGVDVRLGSDAPVARLDPWLAVATAVDRAGDDREPWHPEQAISARQALCFSTDGWGTVAPGHPGDLVLLAEDPLAGDSDVAHARRLRGFADHVAATWVAGELRWDVEGD